MGSGKTTAADILHAHFRHTAIVGLDRQKWIVSHFKRNHKNNAMVYEVVEAMTKTFLRNGVNVIVEQGFRPELAKRFIHIGRQTKSRVVIVSLTAPKPVLLARVRHRMKGRVAKAHPPIAWSRVLRNIRVITNRPPLGGAILDTEHSSPSMVAKRIIKLLKA